MDKLPVKPTWRKPAGIGLILLLIIVWAVLVTSAANMLRGLPWPVHALYYLVAGIVWVLPLKPLLRWMETGRWRK
jgi:carbon starvation protein CstA